MFSATEKTGSLISAHWLSFSLRLTISTCILSTSRLTTRQEDTGRTHRVPSTSKSKASEGYTAEVPWSPQNGLQLSCMMKLKWHFHLSRSISVTLWTEVAVFLNVMSIKTETKMLRILAMEGFVGCCCCCFYCNKQTWGFQMCFFPRQNDYTLWSIVFDKLPYTTHTSWSFIVMLMKERWSSTTWTPTYQDDIL